MTAQSRFDAYFCASPLAAHRHERRGGGECATRLIRCWTPAHDSHDPATDDLVVGLMLGSRGAARWAWDGARANEARARRGGTLGLTPPGARGTFEIAGPSEMLIVALPLPSLRERLLPEMRVPADFGALHDAYRDHPRARALCHRLWRAAAHGPAADPLVDAIAEDLLVEFARRGEAPVEPSRAYDLSGRARRNVCDAADLADADVASLARAAALPVRTFRNSFTRAFGVSPQAWLIARRIDRAAEALRSTGQPIADIAAELGFASQAHMSGLFKRRLGTTPGRYRRAVSGRGAEIGLPPRQPN